MTHPRIKGAGAPLSAADHDNNLLLLSGFPSLAAMLADTARGYGFYDPGHTILVLEQGWRYRVAAPDATDHHLTTAAGLKVHVLPDEAGVYDFRAFNPVANGTTDDYPVLMKALSAPPLPPHAISTIHFPPGQYRMNTTLEINERVKLTGIYGQSRLVIATNVPGIVVNAVNTRNGSAIPRAEAISLGMTSGAGTIIDGLEIYGQTGVTVRGTTDGVWLRAPAKIRNTIIQRFNRHAIRIEAWSEAEKPASPELWGDADGWEMMQARAAWAGVNVLHIRGDRVAGTSTVGDYTYGGHWGVDCHSSSSVNFFACHAATSGVGSSAANAGTPRKSAMVHYGGVRYRALSVLDADGNCTAEQLEKFVTTVPGTDPTVWGVVMNGGAHTWFPTWEAGQAPGHYFPGGGYKASGTGFCLFAGCYGESDDPGTWYPGGNVLDIGGIKERFAPPSGQLRASGGGSLTSRSHFVEDGIHKVLIGPDDVPGALITFTRDDENWRLRWKDRDLVFDHNEENLGFRVTGDKTEETFGLDDASNVTRRAIFHAPMLAMGEDGRRRTYGTEPPATGDWARGDIVWNAEPEPGGWACWTCVEGGSPGEWRPAMAIAV